MHAWGWAQTLWPLGQVKAGGSPVSSKPVALSAFPHPAGGWRRGGAKGGQALHMRRSPKTHPPCSTTGAQQRAGPGRRISPPLHGAGLPAPPPGGVVRPSRPPPPPPHRTLVRGALPPLQDGLWPSPGGIGQEARISSVPTLLSSLLHPQSPKQSLHIVGTQ